jgi:hypothetical protein
MQNRLVFLCTVTIFVSLVTLAQLSAQAGGNRSQEQIKASYNAHHGDFDYLLGDWEFTTVNKQYGKGHGYWTAVRLAEGGQILDEYHVVGDAGETYYSTATLRAYNAVLDQWELVSTDKETGLQNVGTGHREGAEMRIEQKFGVMSPNPSPWRIRYYNIQPDRFSWTADRSTDGGKTWTRDFQQIEARRIGSAQSIGPFTPPQKSVSAAPSHENPNVSCRCNNGRTRVLTVLSPERMQERWSELLLCVVSIGFESS